MSKKLPYIFIFDIDNCIVGNVEYPIYEYSILELIKNNCKQKNIFNKCNKYINFVKILKKGLLRPYFKEFIKFIKKKYKNVEIYLYTNSTYKWTYNGLVYNIEKAANIKFNKPYFTRDYSYDDMSKSISNVYNVIINKLKNKYKSLKIKKNVLYVFNNRLMFIDNIPNNLKDYPKKQVICNSYNYSKPYNIINKIQKKYNINKKIIENNVHILDYILFNNNKITFYTKNKNYLLLNNKNYQNNLWKIAKIKYKNVNKDIFFKKLIKILNKYNNFNENIISKINKDLF